MSSKSMRETIALVAVVGSLAFVALEIRQNTTALLSATRQGLSDQLSELQVAVLTDDHLPGLISRLRAGALPSDFTPDEDQRVRLYYYAFLRVTSSAYSQVSLGVMTQREYATLPRAIWTSAYIQEAWPTMRYNIEPEFAEFVETELLSPP